MWTVGESNPRLRNANAAHYHYAKGPSRDIILKLEVKFAIRYWLLAISKLLIGGWGFFLSTFYIEEFDAVSSE